MFILPLLLLLFLRHYRGLVVASRGHFSDNGLCISCVPGCWGVRVLAASRGKFSDITFVHQATEDEPNGCSVESGPRYLFSTSVCGATHWVKLSDSWPKFTFTDFHNMLHYITQHRFSFYK